VGIISFATERGTGVKLTNTFQKRQRTTAEEVANSASHGVGFVSAVAGAPVLIANASRGGDPLFLTGVCIFAASVVLMYFASSVYHALPAGVAKQRFLTLDHSAIFVLIAGTYTPFTLGVMRGPSGWAIFGVIWALAIVGVYLMTREKRTHPIFSTLLYLMMGWLILFALKPLFERVPQTGILWILAGGLFYTVGVVFFAMSSRLRYGHLVWHLFVMAGTACHYFAVLRYAA
jgi:hemolysin III